ncbi:c-type cytochrome [Telmatocola sphagniphila]|uniref:C-type cytochrome n=1 Tax=Telmatocola sphagniphila TaxID=1123043 RepID=A0A8E6B679_9BACT|nr:PVC-type heme-binding CxxCH protein [Telmatocola sphagniphila]QVL32652.1 c-type cytochrome [Telmatocola sphagniphila]
MSACKSSLFAFLLSTIAVLLCNKNVSQVTAAEPKFVKEDRLVLQLVASDPDIVTPTGIAVDSQGRIWVIENHTHQRPSNYKGPATDRIRLLEDFEPKTGKAKKITTVYEGFKNSMGLAFSPEGRLFLATRAAILELVLSKEGNSVVEKKEILRLETKGDYPHNGLSGFAFDSVGHMIFGLGENLGENYSIVGSDGKKWNGGGEGGSVFRCKPDGSNLERVATGFWNPFAQAYDTAGHLFIVDNDPDARGPCRLVHVIDGGDYGYRFRYGRKGLHPFVCWNGELPGCLPMAAGTLEAPSGLLCYQHGLLPQDYYGKLFSTSWGDHVIEVFETKPKGSSFEATSRILVKGDENFRPVGIVQCPDGTLVFSDWVDKSYPVHGKGKIWRLAPKSESRFSPKIINDQTNNLVLKRLMNDEDKVVRELAAREMVKRGGADRDVVIKALSDKTRPRAATASLHALFSSTQKERTEILGAMLTNTPVQAEALRLLQFDPKLSEAMRPSLMPLLVAKPNPEVSREILAALTDNFDLLVALEESRSEDPFVRATVIDLLDRLMPMPQLESLVTSSTTAQDPKRLTAALVAFQRKLAKGAETQADLSALLTHADPVVRQTLVRIIAEQKLSAYYPKLSDVLSVQPVTRELVETFVAAENWIAFKEPVMRNEFDASEGVIRYLEDTKYPENIRAQFLKLADPNAPKLKTATLVKWAGSSKPDIRLQAVKLLAIRQDHEAKAYFRTLYTDAQLSKDLRSWMALGLANANKPEDVGWLLNQSQSDISLEAVRSLQSLKLDTKQKASVLADLSKSTAKDVEYAEALVRFAKHQGLSEKVDGSVLEKVPGRPKAVTDQSGWEKILAGSGDPAAGERLFFHPNGPKCYSCHRVQGRGAMIGPELSQIGGALKREKLIESILQPSKEIAPLFTAWQITTVDGKSRLGLIISENFDSTVSIADGNGKIERIPKLDIEDRKASTKSLMPDGLEQLMTLKEFRDLIAYLESLK